jgi:hypothetical protein
MLRPTLRRIMINRRGRPFVCFGCGYRLIGLREGCCPECGQSAATPLGGRLRRRTVNPRETYAVGERHLHYGSLIAAVL